jgi:hypothetical protein
VFGTLHHASIRALFSIIEILMNSLFGLWEELQRLSRLFTVDLSRESREAQKKQKHQEKLHHQLHNVEKKER